MGSQISLRQTGLVVFGARIASIFTGLVFLVIITRSLSAQEFGLYEVITDIVAFAAYPAGLVAFWATRDIARGKMFGKTALVLNVALSALGVAIYLVFSYFSAARIPSAGLGTLFFAVLLVPVSYFNQAANSVVQGHRPIVLGYAVIFSEISKLAVAYPLLVVYKVGIDGVILAVMVANLAQAISSVALAGDALSAPVSLPQGRRWLAHSWLPMLSTLPLMLGVADTYVASIAAGNTVLAAHYQAAYSVATLAGYSFYLASAMYPLLLRGGGENVTAMTLDLALAFGIPMVVGAAVLATPILHLLSTQYLDASVSLAILAVSALLVTVTFVFDQTLLGRDRVDVDASARFSDYLQSSILFVAEVNLVLVVAYLVAVYAAVAAGQALGLSLPTTIDLWAIAQLALFVCSITIKGRRLRRTTRLAVPRSIGNYALGALVMGVILYLLEPLIFYGRGTFFLVGELVLVGGAGLLAYAALVFALDKPLREVVQRALREGF